jgi:hypothetical protein
MSSLLLSQEPLPRGQEFDVGTRSHQPLTGVEHLDGVSGRGGHYRDSDLCPAMQVHVPALGHRNPGIAAADLGYHRGHRRPFLLEGTDVTEQYVQRQGPQVHDTLPGGVRVV